MVCHITGRTRSEVLGAQEFERDDGHNEEVKVKWGQVMWRTWEKKKLTEFWFENVKEKENFEDVSLDARQYSYRS